MSKQHTVSKRTFQFWMIDSGLFISGLLAFLSGIYFLFLPVGGYQGGRNPTYGMTVFFERHIWDDLHTWGSLALILIAAVHIPLHWSWIVNMTKRGMKIIRGQCQGMNAAGKFNLLINAVIAISFLVASVTGLYFFLFPGYGGGAEPGASFLFSRSVWDLLHTWSGVVMIAAAVLHFAIHWKWVTKVTRKITVGAFAVGRVPVRR